MTTSYPLYGALPLTVLKHSFAEVMNSVLARVEDFGVSEDVFADDSEEAAAAVSLLNAGIIKSLATLSTLPSLNLEMCRYASSDTGEQRFNLGKGEAYARVLHRFYHVLSETDIKIVLSPPQASKLHPLSRGPLLTKLRTNWRSRMLHYSITCKDLASALDDLSSEVDECEEPAHFRFDVLIRPTHVRHLLQQYVDWHLSTLRDPLPPKAKTPKAANPVKTGEKIAPTAAEPRFTLNSFASTTKPQRFFGLDNILQHAKDGQLTPTTLAGILRDADNRTVFEAYTQLSGSTWHMPDLLTSSADSEQEMLNCSVMRHEAERQRALALDTLFEYLDGALTIRGIDAG